MAQLRVTPDQLDERASKYEVHAGEMADLIAALDSLNSTLQGEWEGNSASKYFATYSELKPSFTKMQELITDLAKELHQQANKFREADS